MGDPRGSRRRGAGQAWSRCAGFLLLVVAAAATSAGAQQGSLRGKLTDLYSRPLGGATVVLRNARTGAAVQTIAARDGSYRFANLAAGEYVLEAASERLGSGRASEILISAGHESRVLTALALKQVERASDSSPRPPQQQLTAPNAPRAHIQPPSPAPAAEVHAVLATSAAAPAPAVEIAKIQGAVIPAELGIASGALPVRQAPPSAGAGMLASIAVASLQAALQDALNDARLARNSVVEPEAARVETSAVLTGEELQALPLAGRDWESFRLDSPPESVTAQTAPAAATIQAGTPSSVDGASTRLAFGGRPTRGRSGNSVMPPVSSESAIREVQVDRVAGDEWMQVETRSGSTARGRVHGQTFLFDRQNLWGARNPFTEWVKETSAATSTTVPVFTPFPWSPGDARISFGAAAGGSLRRHRLSWFAAADNEQRDNQAVSTVRHPDLFFNQPANDEMQVLSARLRLSSANPLGEGLAAYSQMLQTLAGLLGPAARRSSAITGFARVDWNTGERHRFTLEGSSAQWDSPGGGLRRASEMYGSHSFGSSRATDIWSMARWEAFLTPNLLAVTQGSMGLHAQEMPAETPSAFEQTLNVNAWRQLPQMVVDSRYGFTIGNPAAFGSGRYPDEHLYEAQEKLDWVHGKVLVRAGFDLEHNADATSLLRNHTGTYHYARVENFASDALVFAKYGLSGALDPMNQHNCDQRGHAWRDSEGQLHGLGYLPCYSYFTQTLGPTEWHLETNDWAGFATAQWQPASRLVMSAGLRWQRQQMPPPIALVNNPDLPLTQRLPSLGNEWAPRVSLAWGMRESHRPVARLGYGMFYGRTWNSVLETALTQTGSLKGDVHLFMRPTDNLGEGGAPPFPYVPSGLPGTIEKPGATEMAPNFRNAEVHQALASVEEELPGHVLLSASAEASLARRLPVTLDTNFDPATNPGTITYAVVDATGKGPIKKPQITVPFFASWPASGNARGRLNANYQQITELFSSANSTYEAAVVRLSHNGRRGFSVHARYTYAHAMDWNPNEGGLVGGPSVLDPLDFRQEYGTSNLDIRHSASGFIVWRSPWKMQGLVGKLGNAWMISAIGQLHSGLPFTMRTAGSLAEIFPSSGPAIVGLGPGMNGYGGDNRVYGVGRNTFRYPGTWKADLRVGKRIALGHERELELMAQSFNLFNHRNVTEIETVGYSISPGNQWGSLPTLNFLTGLKPRQTEFGQPLNINATDFYRERQIEAGLRLRFKHELSE